MTIVPSITPSQNVQDTIAAIATPVGVGGISVIRISGPAAFTVADAVFRGSVTITSAPSHTIHYGTIVDAVSRETVDTVLVSVFHNPHSFTGDDVVEVSSHGGYFVAQKILTVLYRYGARPAAPGEFTLRAFLNGKMDLTQAEAVADIIQSKTERAHKSSIDQLNGKLSKYVQSLRDDLLNICSLLELELDFAQEGIELAEKNIVLKKLQKVEDSISLLSGSYEEGKVIKEGIHVALVGKPNAGKSSLLNVLLREDRAIVSEIPGTTRDTIEESIILDGVEFIFNDTAGIRHSVDSIELEGMKRTSRAIEGADVILILIDGSKPVLEDDVTLFGQLTDQFRAKKAIFWLFNKSDIKKEMVVPFNLTEYLWISCKDHSGIEELKRRLVEIAIPHHDSTVSSVTITNVRHKEALDKALHSIQTAKKAISENLGGDFAAVDLRGALNYLGEIIGITTPEDILNNIFSKFCIGK